MCSWDWDWSKVHVSFIVIKYLDRGYMYMIQSSCFSIGWCGQTDWRGEGRSTTGMLSLCVTITSLSSTRVIYNNYYCFSIGWCGQTDWRGEERSTTGMLSPYVTITSLSSTSVSWHGLTSGLATEQKEITRYFTLELIMIPRWEII